MKPIIFITMFIFLSSLSYADSFVSIPDSLVNGTDRTIFENYGGYNEAGLSAGWDNRVGFDRQRILIQLGYVCDQVPEGYTITDAQFDFLVYSVNTGQNITMYELDTGFIEDEATWTVNETGTSWSTAGGDYTNYLDGLDSPLTTTRYNMTITDYLDAVCKGTKNDRGVIFIDEAIEDSGKPSVASARISFYSVISTSSNKWKLHVTYMDSKQPFLYVNNNTVNFTSDGGEIIGFNGSEYLTTTMLSKTPSFTFTMNGAVDNVALTNHSLNYTTLIDGSYSGEYVNCSNTAGNVWACTWAEDLSLGLHNMYITAKVDAYEMNTFLDANVFNFTVTSYQTDGYVLSEGDVGIESAVVLFIDPDDNTTSFRYTDSNGAYNYTPSTPKMYIGCSYIPINYSKQPKCEWVNITAMS